MIQQLRTSLFLSMGLILAAGPWSSLLAQAPGGGAKAATPASATIRFRKLAPGVEQVIPDEIDKSNPDEPKMMEVVSQHNLVELLAGDPQYGERPGTEGKSPAKNVAIIQKTWTLKFAFKPVRFIQVDVPSADGRAQPKLVWYLLYHVENTLAEPVKFIPVFSLENRENGAVYPDQLIPVAIPDIQRREDPHRKLLDTLQIEGEIPGHHEVWGVATWTDMDPSMDRFSIFVRGLSNAYEWADQPGYKAGDPPGSGRKLTLKTLQLNFWRPGDALYEHEGEIRYGGIPGDVDYRWLYQ